MSIKALIACLICVASPAVGFTYGQQPNLSGETVHLTVAPNSTSRSEIIHLRSSEQLVVRLIGDQVAHSALVSVFVHNTEGTLVGRDDPEDEADSFHWAPAISGDYYVLLVNTSAVEARVDVSTRTSRSKPTASNDKFATVRVMYATNRNREFIANSPNFGSELAATLTTGICDVSIPREHRLGELEGPSILRLELREDPTKHVMLTSIRVEEDSRAFRALFSQRLATSRKHEALLFIHGFNTTFADAAKRTAQIAYDLAFDGPVILFSWPSQGSPWPNNYNRDQRNADLSIDSLTSFLTQLLTTDRQLTIHIIAHSMGSRVLVTALQHIKPQLTPHTEHEPIANVAFVAPDVDAETFRRIAPAIASSSHRTTLYVSSNDLALRLSARYAGYHRAGEAPLGQPMEAAGIDTIDASSVPTNTFGMGHQYYADNESVLSDLFNLLRDHPPSERFGLRRIDSAGGVYWRFLPAAR